MLYFISVSLGHTPSPSGVCENNNMLYFISVSLGHTPTPSGVIQVKKAGVSYHGICDSLTSDWADAICHNIGYE